MSTSTLLVALQGTGKCSRAWNIANQIAEFQRAKIHAINRLLVGSTARRVLDHTPCDVLVCREGH